MFHDMAKKEINPTLIKFQERLRRIIGPRLLEARNDLSYSQPDLLAELKKYGIVRTQGSISQIEKGLRLPSLEMLYAMLQYYDASANYVLGLSNDTRSLTDIEEEIAVARGEGKLDRAIASLSKEEQEQVIAFAEFLLYRNRKYDPAAHAESQANHPSESNEISGEIINESNQRAISAIFSVMRKHMNQDEIDDAIDEILDIAPEWRELITRNRTSPPKDTGLQGS